MRLVARAFIGQRRGIDAHLQRREFILRLADGRHQRIGAVPTGLVRIVGIQLFLCLGVCAVAIGIGDLYAGILAQAQLLCRLIDGIDPCP